MDVKLNLEVNSRNDSLVKARTAMFSELSDYLRKQPLTTLFGVNQSLSSPVSAAGARWEK